MMRHIIRRPRLALSPELIESAVRVERLLDIDGDDAEAEGVCHFVKQLGRASWIDLMGAERRTLVGQIYGSPAKVFRCLGATYVRACHAYDERLRGGGQMTACAYAPVPA